MVLSPRVSRACEICGEPMLIPATSNRNRWHHHSSAEAFRRYRQERRKTDPEFREALAPESRQHFRALADATSGALTKCKQRGTADEVRYFVEHRHELHATEERTRTTRHLGRSYASCAAMLHRLRRGEKRMEEDTAGIVVVPTQPLEKLCDALAHWSTAFSCSPTPPSASKRVASGDGIVHREWQTNSALRLTTRAGSGHVELDRRGLG